MIQVEMTNQKTYLIDYEDLDDFCSTVMTILSYSHGGGLLRVSEHGQPENKLYINAKEIVAVRKVENTNNQRQILCEDR